MRKLDIVFLVLILFLFVWCLVINVIAVAPNTAVGPVDEVRQNASLLEGRMKELESSVGTLANEQRQTKEDLSTLARMGEQDAAQPKKSPAPVAQAQPAVSRAELEKMVAQAVEKQLKTRRGAALERAKELLDKPNEKQEEMLDEWVRDAVKALKLGTQEENIIKDIIQERNRKLVEELLRDTGTPVEAKLMSVFTGDLFKKVNTDMYDSLQRYYGADTVEAFKKHYAGTPPPLVVPSPDGKDVTVIHAAPGTLEVRKAATGGTPAGEDKEK
jgi:hypothetical protein